MVTQPQTSNEHTGGVDCPDANLCFFGGDTWFGFCRNVLSFVEDVMKRHVVLCVAFLAATGCERPMNITVPDASVVALETVQEVVIEGFGEQSSVVAGASGVRVGWYHDFSAYDSLRINFAAERLSSRATCNHIIVRIGPACYLQDSLNSLRKEFSLFVRQTDIAKSGKAALTFYISEPETDFLLSHLRVIGWRMR
jgi:hypothetical protein